MKTFKFYSALICLPVILSFSSCKTAAEHQQSLPQTKEREMTVGVVQREIYKGMTSSQVAEVLGSPNIVTTDENGQEVWVYDKVASEASYSNSGSSGLGLILFGAYGTSSGASASTQRTLTVVIKFNEDHKVRDFAYHASKF